ncbi:MAG: HD-like signal output (HDOD) protein [Candidatus Krumholzibacteriia bacterium]|jgi:HD-like signal output (HDOD) protein
MSSEVIKSRIMSVMKNLPPLPEVTRQLMTVLGDDNASAKDVAKVLTSDPALAGKVLKLVNSSFYGVSKEVTTISRAVVILGFTGIRNLALGFGSVEALKKMAGGVDMHDFWQHALITGAACQSLVPHLKVRIDPEEAFIGGLMHDIGAYVLATAVPEVYQSIVDDRYGDCLAREHEEFGMTHAQVGQGLLQYWQLPDAFCDAARYHHDVPVATDGERPLTNLVALADVLAYVHSGTFEHGATEAELLGLMRGLDLSLFEIKTALQAMDQKVSEMSSFMKIAGTSNGKAREEKVAEGASFVVVTTDKERRGWTNTVMEHFGFEAFPMDAYFNQAPGSASVAVVLVDAQCLTQQQITQLGPFLAGQSAQSAVLLEDGVNPPTGTEDMARLGIIFSRSEINELVAVQPA